MRQCGDDNGCCMCLAARGIRKQLKSAEVELAEDSGMARCADLDAADAHRHDLGTAGRDRIVHHGEVPVLAGADHQAGCEGLSADYQAVVASPSPSRFILPAP